MFAPQDAAPLMTTTPFAWRHETRQLLTIALPIIATQLLQMSMGVVDTLMAGRISSLALAAIALGTSIYSFAMLLGIGVMMALTPTVSQLLGAGNNQLIREELRQGLWLALCVGVVTILVSLGLANSLHWFGVEPSIIPEAQRYIYWVTWSLPFIFLAIVPRAFNEAKRNTLPMMWIQLLLMPLNILGNYLFMFGHAGFLAMGAAGAALSTGISQVVGCILLFTYTLKTPRYSSYDLAKRMTRPDPAHMMQLLRLGIPISVSLGMEVGMFMVVALLMGSFGVTAAAGHQIALNVASLTFMVPLGTAMALTVQVGNAIGAQSYELARKRGQLGILLCAGFMLLSGVNLWLWGEQIASWYSTDAAVVRAASHFLLFAALFQLGDGIQVSSAGALRGYKDTLYPMLITTFCYWVVGVALGWYLSHYTTLGASGLWLGLVTGLFMAALLLGLRFNSLSKCLLNAVRD